VQSRDLTNYRKRDVSFIFQQYNLLNYLTAAENVQLTSNKNPMEILQMVGIDEDLANKNVLQLSGGQQQRVAIARALQSEGKVLLADEPTGNLDEETADEIIDLLIGSGKKLGKCVIIVTHSNELAKRCDVAYRMQKGNIIDVTGDVK